MATPAGAAGPAVTVERLLPVLAVAGALAGMVRAVGLMALAVAGALVDIRVLGVLAALEMPLLAGTVLVALVVAVAQPAKMPTTT